MLLRFLTNFPPLDLITNITDVGPTEDTLSPAEDLLEVRFHSVKPCLLFSPELGIKDGSSGPGDILFFGLALFTLFNSFFFSSGLG